MNQIQQDERTTRLSGQIAVIFLSITQVALLGAILYRRYVLHEPSSSYTDLRWILGVSVFGFVAARILAGAHIPIIRPAVLIGLYAGFVVTLTGILTVWHGPPTLQNWHVTILPVTLGPALVLGAYVLLGMVARKRAQKYYSDD